MRRPSIEELRSLCIKENWFTCGTGGQYEKMFDMLRDDEPMEKIAFTIAFCSDGDSEDVVLTALEEEFPSTRTIVLNQWETERIYNALQCYVANADITEIDNLGGYEALADEFGRYLDDF